MIRTFGSLFAATIGKEGISSPLYDGVVQHLDINKERATLVVTVRMNATVSKKELWALEDKLAHKMQLASVSIQPQYDAALLSAEYFPEFVCALRRMGKIVNGFLDNATVSLDDKTMTITLCQGGKRL